ncbi:putative motility protein [Marinobacterium sediminicola]|uniref:Motility protein n=1 Tax=Marinobacterium sediminicola TaxID=518898 RepID=A0ABY1RW62_9GAMM|nr:putative motility protein [Marinobacterium sediminicola]ULG70422.1 putative motility protein [Marinobacterium sediminicola]SMR69401.1 Putative motility protein [Marinobacterium sediminicola]
MDIAAMSTTVSNQQTQTQHAVKINQMVKDQTEAVGQQALQLIASAAPVVAPDPSSPLGHNIDIRV